jgi:hypothetical protein
MSISLKILFQRILKELCCSSGDYVPRAEQIIDSMFYIITFLFF